MTTESPRKPLPVVPGGDGAQFCTTRWTQVSLAKADSPSGRDALRDLCAGYYQPVLAYLRCTTADAGGAEELAHEFFAEILAGGSIGGADAGRGRFRSYLLGAVKHFLSHRREAARRQKRGGGIEPEELEAASGLPDPRQLPADVIFDRQWAATLLERALSALEKECAEAGKAALFAQAKPWLTGEAARGEQASLAQAEGVEASALKASIHRLKRRFRQLVKKEVAETLRDPAMIDEEMSALMAALSG